ncbi:MAG: AAA family ATPase [Fibrobacteria bacterium]
MKTPTKKPKEEQDGESEHDSSPLSRRPVPSITSLFHFLWLKKWVILTLWLVLAIPTGIVLSIFDLPRSYTASTVLRFPAVVGAQNNVMRDVAITEGESIMSIMESYQVLSSTIKKLHLRLHILTPEQFRSGFLKAIDYSESLGVGKYTLKFAEGRKIDVFFMPRGSSAEYPIFSGRPVENRISVHGLELQFEPTFLATAKGRVVEMKFEKLESTIASLKESLATKMLGSSNFAVSIKDKDPFLVADVANTLREEFLSVYYGTTDVQDVGILVQMEKDLELAKQKLTKSQDELSQYYAQHPELMRPAGGTPGDNLAYLEARQTIETVQQRRTRLQGIMAAKDPAATGDKRFFWATELLQVLSESGEAKANILKSGLAEINARQVTYRATLGPEHPKILAAEEEKEELYRQLDETVASVMRRMEKDLSDAKIKFASSAPSGGNVAVKVQLELERMNAVNKNNEQIYGSLQESYNRAKLVTGSEFFKVTVVDQARPAVYEPPSFETRLVIAALAVLLLMVIVPAIFLILPIIFVKIWTRQDVENILGLRFLGAVSQRSLTPAGKAEAKDRDGGDIDPAFMKKEVDPLLLYHGKGYTLQDVEAFRIIREEAENTFRTTAHPGKYCLMVTSCHPHEGKSTCASNLAMTFARKGKRTLLVDADFRMGRMHKIFNLDVPIGIDELLNQEDMSLTQFLETSASAFRLTFQNNLVLAPRKLPNANAGELVSSDRFKEFIKMVREQFDVVIIDTPPVMITPEPLSLAEATDGVIFVCRSGETSAFEAREAVASLQDRNVQVAVILNGVRDTVFHRSRYRKYSYYYEVQPTPGNQGGN